MGNYFVSHPAVLKDFTFPESYPKHPDPMPHTNLETEFYNCRYFTPLIMTLTY